MVFPDFAKLFMRSMMLMAMNESRPLVGSSQNRREGFVKNSEANDNLFFSPPDIPLILSSPIRTFSAF